MHALTVEQEMVENLPAEVVNSGVYMDQVKVIIQKQWLIVYSQLVELVQLSVVGNPTCDEVRKIMHHNVLIKCFSVV